jgi:hypothetical protein
VSTLEEVGEADAWRCWICDEPVDPEVSVNDDRGPSIDSLTSKARAKTKAKVKGGGSVVGIERLAHRACNSRKGANAPVIPWSPELLVVEPAPILAGVERLARKGGRAVMARCPSEADAAQATDWLADRVTRLAPDVALSAEFEPGGGQYLVWLSLRPHR